MVVIQDCRAGALPHPSFGLLIVVTATSMALFEDKYQLYPYP